MCKVRGWCLAKAAAATTVLTGVRVHVCVCVCVCVHVCVCVCTCVCVCVCVCCLAWTEPALKAPIAVPALNTGNATGRDPMRPAHAPAASEKTEEPPTVASPGRAAAAEPVDETQTQTRAQQQRDEGALTRAHAEIARLKDENARWKAVNNAMFAKLEEAQKAAAGKAQQRSKKRKASRGASGGDDGGGGGANGGDKRSRR